MKTRVDLERRLRTLTIASWVFFVLTVAVSAWNAIPGYRQLLVNHRSLTEMPHHTLRTALFLLTALPYVSLEIARTKTKARLTAVDKD
jgi:hypothetical protein